METRIMVWGVVCSGIIGTLLWVGLAGAKPFRGGLSACRAALRTCEANLGTGQVQAKPFRGGLPACRAALRTCEANLNSCQADLEALEADLGTCQTNLGTIEANLGTCRADLGMCQADLGTIEANLGTCRADLGMCQADLETLEIDIGALEMDLEVCQADLGTLEADLETCQAQAQRFPATGQTSCWNSFGASIPCEGTGHDGDLQAGGTLSYTDNGDGTITDNNTGLMWAKQSDDGSIHDKDNIYSWDDAFAVYVAALNAEPCFAGYCDWRLPNVKELLSIINFQNFNPAVSLAFNDTCVAFCTVTACSCSAAVGYWSSTSYAFLPDLVFSVLFDNGRVLNTSKSNALRVRAVRGGLD